LALAMARLADPVVGIWMLNLRLLVGFPSF
jgi:hypothetical protein